MNKIEQMHLDATVKVEYNPDDKVSNYYGFAEECSKVTEQIAIEFAGWIGSNYFTQNDNEKWCSELLHYSGCSYSTEELFQQFLKTKQ